MAIYHLDVDPKIVRRIRREFPQARVTNLRVTPRNYRTVRQNWHQNDDYGYNRLPENPVFGFVKGSQIEGMLHINKDGYFHHFVNYLITRFNQYYGQEQNGGLAYLHIDQHLDFSQHFEHACFVGRMLHGKKIPCYIAATALNPKELPDQKPSSDKDLLQLLTEEAEGSFEFDRFVVTPWIGPVKRTWARYVRNISEQNIFLSTDLDAFPPNLFRTDWPFPESKLDLTKYKQLVSSWTKKHRLVAADITGLQLAQLRNPKTDHRLLNPPIGRRNDRKFVREYTRNARRDIQNKNAHNRKANTKYLDNLVEMMDFLLQILKG